MKIQSLSEIHSANGKDDFSFNVDQAMPYDAFEQSKKRLPPGIELTLEGKVLRCKIVNRAVVRFDELVLKLNEAFEVTQAAIEDEREQEEQRRELELQTLARLLGLPLEPAPKFPK
jgi:hypothetical protein